MLDPVRGRELTNWRDRPPIIIDESDAELGSLKAALDLGYVGTSHKNCKGVFKGILNACLLATRRREQPGLPSVLSGEDLVNVGPVALLQDLAMQSCLGVESVERNGHHYMAGLSMFDKDLQDQVLLAHPDLYERSERGWPTLIIKRGRIAMDSVMAAPFGVGVEIPTERLQSFD